MVQEINELEKYIDTILWLKNEHKKASDSWVEFCGKNNIELFNQKKNNVVDIINKKDILKAINNYVVFLLEYTERYSKEINEKLPRHRVKTFNSIENKINKYINRNKEKGQVPISKCLNDIFGLRIITKKYYAYNKIEEFVYKNFPDLKCVESKKNGYIATHIYFKDDNFTFQWELQIWDEGNMESNEESHKKYKQDYIVWEIK